MPTTRPTKQRTVLQLGAGRLMCHSIRKLQEIGFRVLAADGAADAPGFAVTKDHAVLDIRDAAAVAEFALANSVDLILAVNEAGVLAAAEASCELGLPNLSPDVALRCLHKGLMREAWQAAGLPQPAFRRVVSTEEIAAAASAIGYPIILKPAMNWGSRGVSRVAEPEDLPWAIDYARANCRDGEFVIEQCVSGIEMTIEGLVKRGQPQILAWSDKEPQEHPKYRVAMALNYPARFADWQLQRASEVVSRAAQALGIENGAFHCECMVNDDGVFLLEMGGRPGGGHIFGQIVEASSGICMPQALALILLGDDPDIRPKYQHGACYKFFTPPPGVFQEAFGVAEAGRLPGIIDFGFSMQAGTVVSAIAGDADRPGYAVATGETREDAIANADRAISSVRFVMNKAS
jgi:biotin carboxylase